MSRARIIGESIDGTTAVLGTEKGRRLELCESQLSLLLYHREGAKVVPLGEGEPVVVGRSHPADAVIRDRSLSRRHASFVRNGDVVLVEDLGSTNGTLLNGNATTRSEIKLGDEVALGSVLVVLHRLAPREWSSHSLEGFDRFTTRLDEEVMRARTFSRSLTLAVFRCTSTESSPHLRHFLPELKTALRPVDLVGSYGPETVLVSLPELDAQGALALMRPLLDGLITKGTRVIAGISAYPLMARSAGELISGALRALRTTTVEEPIQVVGAGGEELGTSSSMVVAAPCMLELYELVRRVARSAMPILIVGETGTGKELVAREIHGQSPRKDGPLRSINCGAIPASLIESTLFGHERGAFTGADRRRIGLFERAQGGTVFLDEVGELSPSSQVALLRVLESKQILRVGGTDDVDVDVRVVAATNRDLESMCEAGDFREDLLYRLNAITLEVSPLRQRIEEIEPLAQLFLRDATGESGLESKTIADEALTLLRRYSWPGNVRELRNVMERAAVIADDVRVTAAELPMKLRDREDQNLTEDDSDGDVKFKDRVKLYEIDLIRQALRQSKGNQTEAAQILRIPLRTLVHKIRHYDLT